MKIKFWAGLILTVALSSIVFAVPQYLTYQGVLRDSNGNLVSGTKSMTFTVYDAATAGTAVSTTQTEPSVSVSNGSYSVVLSTVSSTIFNGSDRWLEVAVDGTTLTPRLRITSVSYAINADNAATLAGRSSASSGNNIVPYTDSSTGKLNASVIPSGVGGGNADTLASFHAGVSGASIVPTTDASGYLNLATIPPSIDGTKLTSNISITTTGSVAANSIKTKTFLTSGTGNGYCIGTGTIAIGDNAVTGLTNSAVTANSKIFICPTYRGAATVESLAAYNISAGTFDVSFCKTSTFAGDNIPFIYLIIN